jgi:GAF domain-containing protein
MVPTTSTSAAASSPRWWRNGQLLGFLYADLDGLFGRLHDGDRDLLATLAAQAAVALANLRTQEGLERQVAERTAQLEQRSGELALINSIQQGVAAQLSFQGIVDAGRRQAARGVQDRQNVGVRVLDLRTGLVHFMTQLAAGRRVQHRPRRWLALMRSCARALAADQRDLEERQRRLGASLRPRTRQGIPRPVAPDVPLKRGADVVGLLSMSHLSASTPMARPRCACSRPWPRA